LAKFQISLSALLNTARTVVNVQSDKIGSLIVQTLTESGSEEHA
jgi:hypothetical protein